MVPMTPAVSTRAQQPAPAVFPGKRPFLGINFLVGDIQTGIMPLLAVDLAYSLHWNAGQIGWALGFGNLALLLAQPFGGLLADRLPEKRWTFFGFSVLFTLGCLSLLGHPSPVRVYSAQGLIGVSTALIIPVLSAMAMGLAGKKQFPRVMGLAQGANHAGSVAGALVVGFLARHWDPSAVFLFYGISSFCAGLLAIVIPAGSIDPLLSRESRPDGTVLPLHGFLKTPVLLFLLTVFLFFVANTAMLPLAGEKLANRMPEPPGEVIAWAIVVTQSVMTVFSLLTPRLLKMAGTWKIFSFCLFLLPIRGFFLTVATTQSDILEIQVLDGIATGILSVLLPVLVAEIAKGTGRFNAMIGFLGAMISAGGFLSQIVAGQMTQMAGTDSAFLVLAGISAFAAILGVAGSRTLCLSGSPLEPLSPTEG
jgi:MFS family permease